MIICQCTGTTDRDIARLRAEGLGTVAAVAKVTGAGRNCAPCRIEIVRLLTLPMVGPADVGNGSSAPDSICAA